MASKCTDILKYTIIPLSILLISLSQLFFQYSSITTHRTEKLDKIDQRYTVYTFNLLGGKYEFNYEKIKEIFDDNALMQINMLKNFTLKTFDNLNEKRDNKLDKKQYMILYIMIYDLIYIIFLYAFFFRYYKAGIIKILMQILKCIFLVKRINKTSPELFIYEAIYNHFDNILGLRGFNLFTPEGYVILDLILNLVLILDISWLIILIKDKCNENKYIYKDNEILGKEVINDDQRVDYKESNGNSGNIYKEEDKILSNDNNIITKDDNSDDDNNRNSNDENDDIDINNNKDEYNINNKDEDNINNEDENIESNNKFKYRSYNENNENDSNDREVNNSFEEDKKEENIKNVEEEEEEKEDNKESNHEEDDMNNNQESN